MTNNTKSAEQQFSAEAGRGFEDPSLRRRRTRFLGLFFFALIATMLSAAGLFGGEPRFILGLPAGIVYLTCCLLIYCLITVYGYLNLFKPWSKNIDQNGEG